MEQPFVFWVPSIGTSGMMFYTGHQFPAWVDNLFVGALSGRQVQRVLFTDAGSYGRESLLAQFGERVRDVRQGPDELVYVATDAGRILRIDPAELLASARRPESSPIRRERQRRAAAAKSLCAL